LIQIAVVENLAEGANDVRLEAVIHGEVGIIPLAQYAEADEILMVLLSPYHKLEENEPRPVVQRSALPPQPPGLIGSIGYVLDLALIGTFENDFEELRKVNRRVHQGRQAEADHREVRCAVIAPADWITPLDIIRYRPDRTRRLRELGRQATLDTFDRIKRLGWDSLYGVDEA